MSFCLVLLGIWQLQAVSYNTVPVPSSKQFGIGYASHFKISSSEEAFVLGICGLTWSDFPKRSYDGYRAFVDSRIADREKRSGKSAKDHQWCVEYSYIDLLTFSGWGKKAGYSTEDALGDAVLSANDDPLSFVEWRTDDLTPYLKSCPQGSSFLQSMDDLLDKANGWMATVIYYDNYTWYGTRFSTIGHGVAICGFSYNPSKNVTDPTALKGLFVVESDNDRENGSGGASAPDTITYCPVSWNGSRYQVSNVFGATGYLDPSENGRILYSETTPSVVTVSSEDAVVDVKCRVTFGKNGGTGGDDYVTATYGQPMPTQPPRTAPKKNGFSFGGYWDTLNAGGKQYYDANMKSVRNWDKQQSTFTLWAKWTAIPSTATYRVTFGKNGGTGGDSYVTATFGKPMPAPRTAPKKSGWTFGGYWDTLACDKNGNPLGKQYYNAQMQSVRNWDKNATGTLWAKWTVRVKLGKNGGTGGDDYVTVIYGQPFPIRKMPVKSGYKFGGYWVSASSCTGQCYNEDGTGTSTMKWTTGGSPTIWALWIPVGDTGNHYYVTVAAKSGSYRYEIPFSGSGNMSYSGFTPSASWLKKDSLGISYNAGSSSGTFNIYYSVTANTSSANRTATMTGIFGGSNITLHITQSAQ